MVVKRKGLKGLIHQLNIKEWEIETKGMHSYVCAQLQLPQAPMQEKYSHKQGSGAGAWSTGMKWAYSGGMKWA